jgi:hypothetical protein
MSVHQQVVFTRRRLYAAFALGTGRLADHRIGTLSMITACGHNAVRLEVQVNALFIRQSAKRRSL